jgi:hypothetical protein
MSRVKLLKNVVDDLHALANSLGTLATAIESDESQASQQEPEAPALTLSDVRAVLARKSQAGFTKDIKALIARYGAEKLSDVKPEHYRALLQEVEALGND